MIYSNGKTEKDIIKLLRETLATRFDPGELRVLAFETELGVFNISEQNGTQQMSVEIVGYANRRGQLSILWDYVAQKRPDIGFAMWDGSVPDKPEPIHIVPIARDNMIAELETHLIAAIGILSKLKAQ